MKSVARILVVIMLISGLSLSASAKTKVTFAVTVGPNAQVAQALEPLVEERLPDIDLEIAEIPWTDIYQVQLLDFMSKRGAYDIVMQSTSFFSEYVLGQHLEPLDKYFDDPSLVDKKEFDFEDLIPDVVDKVGRYDGKLYALPYMHFPQVIMYRKDLLKAAGLSVPKTFAEYMEVVKALHNPPEVYGTAIQGIKGGAGSNTYNFYPVLFSFGANLVDENGNPNINSPEAVEALQFYVDLYKYAPKESINMGSDHVNSAFAAGDIGIMIQDADMFGGLIDPEASEVADQVGFSVLPSGPADAGVPGQGTALMSAWSAGISAYSENKEAAFKVLTTLLGKDIAKEFARAGGLSPRKSVLEDLSDEFPNFTMTLQALKDVKPIPVVPDYSFVEEALASAISQALLGQKTPKSALDQAQRVLEAVMNR